MYCKSICNLSVTIALSLIFLGLTSCLNAQVRLYQTTRFNGSLQELDVNNGSILASNVAGIVNARGMDFSPLGGLYLCMGTGVLRLDNPASTPVAQLSYTGEVPHDLCFDASGNLYVVTNLNVYVYNTSLTQLLTFPHNLTTVTGTGGTNKGWGIEIRPDNGEIYVVGRQGLRRFDPANGSLLGSLPNSSSFGFPCVKFSGSGFNNSYVYLGSVISGQDQIRVYDSNLNYLRSFFPPHNGNPIDLEIHPTTQDIYLINTDGANPTNRMLPNETLSPGWATFSNPGRGSALGDFAGVVLPAWNLQFRLEEVGEQVHLSWHHEANSPATKYFVERLHGFGASIANGSTSGNGQPETLELGWQDAPSEPGQLSLWDAEPINGGSRYRLRAVDVNGEVVGTETVILERAGPETLFLVRESDVVWVSSRSDEVKRIVFRIMDLSGRVLIKGGTGSEMPTSRPSGNGPGGSANGNMTTDIRIDLSALAEGLYLLEAQAYDQNGRTRATKVFKLLR